MALESGRQPSAEICPRHKTADDVRRVSVLYEDDSNSDDMGAGSLLSPRPVLKAAGRLAWAGTGLGVLGMASIWVSNVVGGGAVKPGLLAACVCFAYALALYGWAGARRARLTRVERGSSAALTLWRTAWYCTRCDGVFFPPAAMMGGELLTAAEFRRAVWAAGGYGDLGAGAAPASLRGRRGIAGTA